MKVRIAKIRDEATDVRSYRLEPEGGENLPEFTAGSHVDVFISEGLSRQYSICSDPADTGYYRVGIQKDANSTGGSEAVFREFAEGQVIEISEPRNHFRLKEDGVDFTLIGGGIGITPILAMAQRLAGLGKSFRLYYLARSEDRFGFADLLKDSALSDKISYHNDAKDGLPDLAAMIGAHEAGRHVYCCGPTPLMDAVKDTCRAWPPMTVHFEHFTAVQSDTAEDTAFEVQLGQGGEVLTVGADQTLLEVLRAHGLEIETQCTQGLCGTCEQAVLEGDVDHRDLVLDDDEKAENSCMMVCVSRAKSGRLVLDV
ncbi:PDR/VanB family oxidoreductase [uncultured Roseovarius sp.]|uniref:PDR/VanB family oxidoreductase n=1 Tax=uncultured Roseovarius sp. TaxID=293344 RepID=UPI002632402C|nr:PDR/VanB family oxidoreductase [uncultured Roseovarius sp.]